MANFNIFYTKPNGATARLSSADTQVDFGSVRIGADNLTIGQDGSGGTAAFSFGGKRITNVGAPTGPNDLATKTYLDTNLATKVDSTALGSSNGVPTLDSNGKIPSSMIPAIALTETYVLNSEADMLASGADIGDLVIRTDNSTSYILSAAPATTLANWVQILTPPSPVQSVNGQTGTVSLATNNISEGGGVLYFTNARAKAAAVANALNSGVTDVAPSQDAVYTAIQDAIDSAGTVESVNGIPPVAGDVTISTDDIPEATNLFFTAARAKAAAVTNSLGASAIDVAPSQAAVNTALGLKENNASAVLTLTSDDAGSISSGQIVVIKADGAISLGDASAVGTDNYALGVAQETIASTASGKVLVAHGKVVGGFTGLTPGQKVWLSPVTPGALVQNLNDFEAGDQVYRVGRAVSATQIVFSPAHEFEF